MRKLLTLLSILALCSVSAFGQGAPYGVSQSFQTTVILAPPTVVALQNSSTSAGTAANFVLTGGAVAAGSYRICVTYFSITNTETPCSVDTTAASVLVTTGATSIVTIQPPVPPVGGPNVVGWRPYVGATGGATGAETLQTITSAVCALSASSTPSCLLSSPAVFTVSTNFIGGAGGPATPGTLLTPAILQASVTSLFENSSFASHTVSWTTSGTAPSACTFNIQDGTLPSTLANVGQTITCTTSGSYTLPLTASGTYAAYFALNVATFTAADTTTKVTFTYTATSYPTAWFWGPAAPTSACLGGMFVTTVNPSILYSCVATTWTVVTLP